jgi:hypothetical protein
MWLRAALFGILGAVAGGGVAIGLAVTRTVPAYVAAAYGADLPMLGAMGAAGGWLLWAGRGLWR